MLTLSSEVPLGGGGIQALGLTLLFGKQLSFLGGIQW